VAFSDVRWYRHGRFSDLVPKDRLLGFRKPLRRSITAHGKVHRFLPHKKISERFDFGHASLKRTRRAATICLNKAMVGRLCTKFLTSQLPTKVEVFERLNPEDLKSPTLPSPES
jgi:hypothetical protein